MYDFLLDSITTKGRIFKIQPYLSFLLNDND